MWIDGATLPQRLYTTEEGCSGGTYHRGSAIWQVVTMAMIK